MATIDRLERAFIAADDAGETEDASAFAAEIREMRAGATQEPDSRSSADEFGRQVALTARYGLEGTANTVGIVADPMSYLLSKVTGTQQPPPLGSAVSEGLTQMGLPSPESSTEQVVGSAARTLAGTGAMMKGAKALPAAAEAFMTSQPWQQALSSILGGGAGEAVKQSGGGIPSQLLAGLAGGFSPALVTSGAPALTRAAFRGGATPKKILENVDTFSGAGTTPTVGQATEARFPRAIESLLAKTPGGAGVIERKAGQQAQEISDGLESAAGRLSNKTTSTQAGLSIERGISGEKGFLEQFKAKQEQLYGKLDKYFRSDEQIPVSNTRKILDELNTDIAGAPELSKWFKNAKISGIRGALVKDTEGVEALLTRPDIPPAFKKMLENQTGPELMQTIANLKDKTLPYEAIKKLRTLVGREISDSTFASDVPRSKWKALYAALSDDMGAAVATNPRAKGAWERANTYTRTGLDRLDVLRGVMDKNGGPEKVFQAAIAGTKEGATTLRSVMQSLPAQNQKDFAATIVRRLGRAKSGQQNDAGDVFSTQTFLTNWANLSPQAKSTIFNRFGPEFRADMDKIAKVSSNLRDGSKVFANPSGTGPAIAQATTIGSFFTLLATGHPGLAGAVVGGVALSNLSAKLMVNPRFVRWLARNSKEPVGSLAAQAQVLQNIGKRTGDDDIIAAAEALQQNPNGGRDNER